MARVKLCLYVLIAATITLAYWVHGFSQADLGHYLAHAVRDDFARPWFVQGALFALAAGLTYYAVPLAPLIYLTFGYLYGPAQGALLSLLASTLGAYLAYLFYRQALPPSLVARFKSSRPGFKWWLLLSLRLSPVFPAPLATFAASVMGASRAEFLVTTLIGGAPLALLYACLGSQWRRGWTVQTLQSSGMAWYVAVLALGSLAASLGPAREMLQMFRQTRRRGPQAVPVAAL